MRRCLLLSGLIPALILFFCSPLQAQSDKEILRTAKEKLAAKKCDTAFYLALSVNKTKSGKVQDILKKSYPGLISKNTRSINAIKVIDKESPVITADKLSRQIIILKSSAYADSMLKISLKENDYKKLSKKKSIDRSIKSYNDKLKIAVANIEKLKAKQLADSLAREDSLRKVAEQERLQHIQDSIAAADTMAKNQTNPPAVTATGQFYIIAGSFPSEEEAQKQAETLRKKGFPNASIVNKNQYGNIRIAFNSYKTRAEAKKDLGNIRGKYRKDAWILELPEK